MKAVLYILLLLVHLYFPKQMELALLLAE